MTAVLNKADRRPVEPTVPQCHSAGAWPSEPEVEQKHSGRGEVQAQKSNRQFSLRRTTLVVSGQ